MVDIIVIHSQQHQKKIGVISASAGNHALGLAYHGFKLNIPVVVVMPLTSPLMKQELCKQFKANVILFGKDFGEVIYLITIIGAFSVFCNHFIH